MTNYYNSFSDYKKQLTNDNPMKNFKEKMNTNDIKEIIGIPIYHLEPVEDILENNNPMFRSNVYYLHAACPHCNHKYKEKIVTSFHFDNTINKSICPNCCESHDYVSFSKKDVGNDNIFSFYKFWTSLDDQLKIEKIDYILVSEEWNYDNDFLIFHSGYTKVIDISKMGMKDIRDIQMFIDNNGYGPKVYVGKVTDENCIERHLIGTPSKNLRAAREILLSEDLSKLLEAISKFKNKFSGYDNYYNYITQNVVNGNAFQSRYTLLSLISYLLLEKKHPQMEQLIKAGFVHPIYEMICNYSENHEKLFARCFKNEPSIPKICQFPKMFYDEAKSSSVIKINELRILANNYGIVNQDQADFVNKVTMFGPTVTTRFKYLVKRYNGLDKLRNYLERLDIYQAIPLKQAILLLYDYVKICQDLNIPPKYFTNSLKREHDVASRNHLYVKRKIDEEKFNKQIAKYDKYVYTDGEYAIVIPKSQDDVIREGAELDHCVGSYLPRIANGRSVIVFLRKANKPEEPFVTIELDKKNRLVQVSHMSNKGKLTIKEQNFVDKWLSQLE